jgi:dTDP-glucose 4,6-dehydratase
LDWKPLETFETWLKRTVQWYLDNETWWRPLQTAASERRGIGDTPLASKK